MAPVATGSLGLARAAVVAEPEIANGEEVAVLKLLAEP